MTPSPPVGIAVWGIGEHARRNVLPAIAACPSVRLIGLASRNDSVRAAEAAKWGCGSFASPEQMLADSAVEAVYLSTPVALHAEHGLAVLAARRHLWCEKVLAASLTDAETLIAESRRVDRALCEVLMYVHHRQFKTLQARLAEGRIGKIRKIDARFVFPHLNPENMRYRPELGGGAFLDSAIYPLSAAEILAGGDPRAIEARFVRETGYAVDIGGTARLAFSSGVEALCEWGFGRPYRAEIEITGETGGLVVPRAFSKPPDFAASLVFRGPEGDRETVIGADNHFAAMLAVFAAAAADPVLRERERDAVRRRARLLARVRQSAA